MRRLPLSPAIPAVILVQLLVSPGFVSTAHAAADAASAERLSQALALDKKCSFLETSDREQLQDYVAQIEISLAENLSVQDAQAAMARGRDTAKTAECNDDARSIVVNALSQAGNVPASAVSPSEPAAAPDVAAAEPAPQAQNGENDDIFGGTPPDQAAKPDPAPQVATEPAASPDEPPSPVAVARAEITPSLFKKGKTRRQEATRDYRSKHYAELHPSAELRKPKSRGLMQYASLVEGYFFAVKCRTMSGRDVKRLYANVLVSHQHALASNRGRDVKAAMAAAEQQAGARSCD